MKGFFPQLLLLLSLMPTETSAQSQSCMVKDSEGKDIPGACGVFGSTVYRFKLGLLAGSMDGRFFELDATDEGESFMSLRFLTKAQSRSFTNTTGSDIPFRFATPKHVSFVAGLMPFQGMFSLGFGIDYRQRVLQARLPSGAEGGLRYDTAGWLLRAAWRLPLFKQVGIDLSVDYGQILASHSGSFGTLDEEELSSVTSEMEESGFQSSLGRGAEDVTFAIGAYLKI